jgi:hypothetical protein
MRKIDALTGTLVNENAMSALFDEEKFFGSAHFPSLQQSSFGIARTHRLDD